MPTDSPTFSAYYDEVQEVLKVMAGMEELLAGMLPRIRRVSIDIQHWVVKCCAYSLSMELTSSKRGCPGIAALCVNFCG